MANLRRRGLGLALLALCLAGAAWLSAPPGAAAVNDQICFAVNGAERNPHYLTVIDRLDFNPQTNETTIGPTMTLKSEALTIHPTTGALISANSNMTTKVGYIGTFDVTNAHFSPLPNPIGTANGALGAQPLYDISGLSFDLASGLLYGVAVRWTSVASLPDLLFQVNLQTGKFVPDAFGPGKDYVVLNLLPAYPNLENVDDMAIDPLDGQMYAVINGADMGDRLVKVDKRSGALTDLGALGVNKVAGLSFDPTGQLWGTAGGSISVPNHLYQIDKVTAQVSNPRIIDNGINYEALTCMVALNTPAPSPTAPPTTPTPGVTPNPTQNPNLHFRAYLPFVSR